MNICIYAYKYTYAFADTCICTYYIKRSHISAIARMRAHKRVHIQMYTRTYTFT